METKNPTVDENNISTTQNKQEEIKEIKNISENIKTESLNNIKQNISEEIPINDFDFPVVNVQKSTEDSKNQEISSPKEFKKLCNIPEKYKINESENKKINSQFFTENPNYLIPITFSCSYNSYSNPKSKNAKINQKEFLEKIIKIADVTNLSEFWEVFQHLQKPSNCPIGTDYHVFKKGISPMWEDKANKQGGKLSVLINLEYSSIIWEEVIFNFAKGILPYFDFINGIILSKRPKFSVLSFWVKSCNNNYKMVEKIRMAYSNLLQTPSNNCFDFIPFY